MPNWTSFFNFQREVDKFSFAFRISNGKTSNSCWKSQIPIGRCQLPISFFNFQSATGITVRDTPERVAQAEHLVAQFELRDSSAAVAANSEKEQPDEFHVGIVSRGGAGILLKDVGWCRSAPQLQA